MISMISNHKEQNIQRSNTVYWFSGIISIANINLLNLKILKTHTKIKVKKADMIHLICAAVSHFINTGKFRCNEISFHSCKKIQQN